MKKIVINGCYGGFGLSHAGIMRYAKLAGFELYCFTEDGGFGTKKFRSCNPMKESILIPHYSKKPLSEDGKYEEDGYFSESGIDRDDPHLIQIVEELGDAAGNKFANLEIVEIPDDVDWEIEEYDGNEWIAEKHRTWRR